MDKTRFLLLTGSIAAGGAACVIREAKDPATPVTPVTTTTTTTTPGATQGADPGARHVTTKQVGSLRGVTVDNGDGGAPAPTPAPTTACLDDTATASGDCATISDKTCSWASKRCTAYKTYLKGKVGASAVACTLAASSNACSGTTTVDCGRNAVKAACVDAKVATACATLAPKCKDTADNCTAAFSALNAAGQQQALTYCAGEGACNSGISACVEAALFPAAEGVGGSGPRR
jgi:hypothetical protein